MSIHSKLFSSLVRIAPKFVVGRRFCSVRNLGTETRGKGFLSIGARVDNKRSFGMTTRVLDGVGGGEGEWEGKRVRKFAPLGGEGMSREGEEGVRKLRGIIFDMDGTLCEPQTYMFGQMRSALGIDKSIDILDHIYSLPVSDQEAAHEKIRAIEREAMPPNPLHLPLHPYSHPPSRNPHPQPSTPRPPSPHNPPPQTPFSPIITREFRPPKPHPAGILHIAKEWNVDPKDTIMVGDSIDDMKAGFAAGAATVLLGNSVNEELWEHECTDLVVKRLDELVEVLKGGLWGGWNGR
ncbi:putative had superfamily protein [Botrytis fragariae]|uniref:Putative had superfamily protein n=1 Tax=Botrytis fragariae TaxID=1964551 RepID=A0A8H6AM57_9HELO|nr:putative had superfamily protein [Botrytis fragariae]KAF5869830.1 putative had superfamily protein [Botrytis fragariae]